MVYFHVYSRLHHLIPMCLVKVNAIIAFHVNVSVYLDFGCVYYIVRNTYLIDNTIGMNHLKRIFYSNE